MKSNSPEQNNFGASFMVSSGNSSVGYSRDTAPKNKANR